MVLDTSGEIWDPVCRSCSGDRAPGSPGDSDESLGRWADEGEGPMSADVGGYAHPADAARPSSGRGCKTAGLGTRARARPRPLLAAWPLPAECGCESSSSPVSSRLWPLPVECGCKSSLIKHFWAAEGGVVACDEAVHLHAALAADALAAVTLATAATAVAAVAAALAATAALLVVCAVWAPVASIGALAASAALPVTSNQAGRTRPPAGVPGDGRGSGD